MSPCCPWSSFTVGRVRRMPHGEGEDGQKHQQDTAKTDKSANKSGRISGQASAHAVCKHAQPGCSHMLDAGIGPSMEAVILRIERRAWNPPVCAL